MTMYVNGSQVAINSAYTQPATFPVGGPSAGPIPTDGRTSRRQLLHGLVGRGGSHPVPAERRQHNHHLRRELPVGLCHRDQHFQSRQLLALDRQRVGAISSNGPGHRDPGRLLGQRQYRHRVRGCDIWRVRPYDSRDSSSISLNGSSGYVGTTSSYVNPAASPWSLGSRRPPDLGGTIIGFDSSQNNETGNPNYSDRLLWMDNTGHLVWAVYDNSVTDEITRPRPTTPAPGSR